MVVFDNRPQHERDRDVVVAAEKEADQRAFIERTKAVNAARHAEEAAKQSRLDAEQAEFDARMTAIRVQREAAEAGERARIEKDVVSALVDLQTRVRNLEDRLTLRAGK